MLDDAAAHKMDVSTYINGLETEPALMQTLLDRVTVQETSFFRDPNQFAALRNTVLADVTGPVSIWSAGCANGQEAYSLAMTLADMERVDWRIAATDISSRALERTRRATYTTRELAQVSTDDRCALLRARRRRLAGGGATARTRRCHAPQPGRRPAPVRAGRMRHRLLPQRAHLLPRRRRASRWSTASPAGCDRALGCSSATAESLWQVTRRVPVGAAR